MSKTAELLFDLFRGRPDVYAEQNGTTFNPYSSPLTLDDVEGHLAGRRCVGIYPIQTDNAVLCTCVDIDNHKGGNPEWQKQATRVASHLRSVGLHPLVEVSQSGTGAHVWLILNEPVLAKQVRGFWKSVGAKTGIRFKEIYPMQDSLDTPKAIGNLIRVPLYNKSHFVDDTWQPLDAVAAMSAVVKVSADELQIEPCEAVSSTAVPVLSPRVQQLVTTPRTKLAERWAGSTAGLKDESRSSLCCSIVSALIRRHIPTSEVENALLVWCQQNGYDKGSRPDWIKATVAAGYEFAQEKFPVTDSEPVTYQRITCAELASSDYKEEYLIDGMLVANQPGALAGPRKSLKTSILFDLALAIAQCGLFLNYFRVNRECRVAVMSGESGLATLQETGHRISASQRYKLADVKNLIVSPSLPKFGDERYLSALDSFIKADGIEVLAIDPTYLAMPGADAGNLFIQGAMLRDLNDLCQANHTTLILAHHTRKAGRSKTNEAFEPLELDDLAWAGFQEFVRQWILIGRREKYEPGTGQHKLWLNVGGSAGHSALWAVDVEEGVKTPTTPRHWGVTVTGATVARAEAHQAKRKARLEEFNERFTQALKARPDGDTLNCIRAAAHLNPDNAKQSAEALLTGGVIMPSVVTKRGRDYPGYRLAV